MMNNYLSTRHFLTGESYQGILSLKLLKNKMQRKK